MKFEPGGGCCDSQGLLNTPPPAGESDQAMILT